MSTMIHAVMSRYACCSYLWVCRRLTWLRFESLLLGFKCKEKSIDWECSKCKQHFQLQSVTQRLLVHQAAYLRSLAWWRGAGRASTWKADACYRYCCSGQRLCVWEGGEEQMRLSGAVWVSGCPVGRAIRIRRSRVVERSCRSKMGMVVKRKQETTRENKTKKPSTGVKLLLVSSWIRGSSRHFCEHATVQRCTQGLHRAG